MNNWQAARGPLRHLGTLHGKGDLLTGEGTQNLGSVTYEIDSYARRSMRSDNGRIEGSAAMLAKAFRAGSATIVLADGQSVDVSLADPNGAPATEVQVTGRFPQVGHAA
jgi:hypothetical protein